MRGNLWTREELILVFNLYLKLPFGKLHKRTPEIIELAKIMGRSVNSISLRLVNFASCDPFHQNRGVKGMLGGLKQCQPIWDEFANKPDDLLYESEIILVQKQNKSIESTFCGLFDEPKELKGEDKVREIKTRVNQSVFRQIVLANYNSRCAITGIDIPELLIASHIIPWSVSENERLNPENGVCMSALYDKAFDRGLIGVNNNFEIIISRRLHKEVEKEYFANHFALIVNKKLQMPQKYLPKKEFFEWHLDTIFDK